MTSPLAGKRVLVTRERPGELGAMLEARGATVVHVPLIEIREPADGGERFRRELAGLRNYDWLVVTSVPGAERTGRAAADARRVALAAVGSATARVLTDLAERPVDLLPSVQQAAALADLLVERCHGVRSRMFVAQADRAEPTLVDRLIEAGHDVTACVAYRTVLLRPDASTIADADALGAGQRFVRAGLGRCVRTSDTAGGRGDRADHVGRGGETRPQDFLRRHR